MKRTHQSLGLWQLLVSACVAPLAVGCAHTIVVSQSFVAMDQAGVSPDATDAKTLAPQEFQHAEQERALAYESKAHHDDTAADLHSERALVAFERAVVLARLARATTAGETARVSLTKEEAEVQRLAAARATFEGEAATLANQLAVAREALTPAHIGPADPAREKARLLAARSLAAEATLLCGAAELLTPTQNAPEAAAHEASALESLLSGTTQPNPATSLATAAHARAACLASLTHVRRNAVDTRGGGADSLLAALSARGGWDPTRDERGVVVTFRGAFKGTALTPDADRQLRELGRVAAIHPSFPLQIVLHDASVPSAHEHDEDAKRVLAARTTLLAGDPPGVKAETATVGANLPTTDPTDAQSRSRNARLEIVFVSPDE